MYFPETVIAALLSYVLMLVAYKYSHVQPFHRVSMGLVILFDLAMPFYLVATRDWKERLIDGGEILTFLVWMHFGLVITLYVLYFLQVQAGIKLLKGDQSVRAVHHSQGKGILLTRTFVILTGWLLYEPEEKAALAHGQ